MSTYDTQHRAPRPQARPPALAVASDLRIRWGPVWAGALVALPLFLVLQSLFFAIGWLDLGFTAGNSATAASAFSGFLALVASFTGGVVAGSFAVWGDISDGLIHGLLTWALGVLVIVVFALLGGGAILGAPGSLLTQITTLQQLFAQGASFDSAQAMAVVRQTAGWSALVLGLTAAAAAAGGVLGAKVWPPRRTGSGFG